MDNSPVISTNNSTDSNCYIILTYAYLFTCHMVISQTCSTDRSTDFITVVNLVWISLQEDLLML